MLSTELIDQLESGAMYAAPLLGGAIACYFGVRAKSALKALGRTFLLSLVFGFVIALVVGLVIDASLSGQQWQRWDGLWLPLLQIPFSAFSGLIFGAIALKVVGRREEKELLANSKEQDAA